MKEKRLIIAICLMLLIAIVGIGCKADVQTKRITYIVQPNDTLWDIATEYCPKGMNKNEYIFNLKKANAIQGYIQPGDHLEILVEE